MLLFERFDFEDFDLDFELEPPSAPTRFSGLSNTFRRAAHASSTAAASVRVRACVWLGGWVCV